MVDFNPQCITYSEMNMIFNARFYYRRLTTWTRAYLMSRYFGIGTEEALFGRLYKESLEIGDMMQIIFGRQPSERYSQMVSEYAIAFNQLISAQLAGDGEAIKQNVDRLYRNVADRAVFLENMNPYWSAAGYIELFNAYIRYTLETANAILTGDSAREIELNELLNQHTNRMGDVFAQGLYAYITSGTPADSIYDLSESGVPCITYEQMNDIYTIRMLWFELVTWVRIYMISRFTGAGNSDMALTRLMRVPAAYVDALIKFFPHIDREEYLRRFTGYIGLLSSFITGLQENNAEELNRITMDLYENANHRAAFVASINPFWSVAQWSGILQLNLRSTMEEAATFLSGDYQGNIEVFTALLDQAETSSTFLAQGLFDYVTQPQTMQ